MNLSPVFGMQFKNTVERILHVKGNYTAGTILEMTVIVDDNLEKEQVVELLPQLLRMLKMHSEVFRNVRLNVVNWKSDADIKNKVSPMSMVMLSNYYEDYVQTVEKKQLVTLVKYLKLFQARAKLLILLTDGAYETGPQEVLEKEMQPFLEKKFMQVIPNAEKIEIRYR